MTDAAVDDAELATDTDLLADTDPDEDEDAVEEPDTGPLDELLDKIYLGQERISQADIYRRAVAAELPAALLTRIAALPQGEYAVDEAADLLGGSAV
ncbi:hypothetical protein ACH4OY_23865 [Micromonospora rubida]|uniref:Uncharacterized protein n=1 Tax=Micromonospora rubida TaxID=2697657 RepID=A0ABW7SPR4_9ACTN